jgi:hypothetical protein
MPSDRCQTVGHLFPIAIALVTGIMTTKVKLTINKIKYLFVCIQFNNHMGG